MAIFDEKTGERIDVVDAPKAVEPVVEPAANEDSKSAKPAKNSKKDS